MRVPVSLYGVLARILTIIIPIKKKCWVFGSDYGKMYREGSRFLMEYMLENHTDYNCVFITRTYSVKQELDEKGIPCEMNFSFKGLLRIARAEVVFTTQSSSDILFVYKKRHRKFFFLSHGQPYKAVFLATPKEYGKERCPEFKGTSKLTSIISKLLICDYEYWDSDFYTSTSEFLVPYNKLYYGTNSIVKVLGMPRNDIFFSNEKLLQERWLPNLENKIVITYMPTHRGFGFGDLTPTPFAKNNEVQSWMRLNNVVLIIKQHPNMENKSQSSISDDVIIDITKMKFDPQICLYHSDALITDYSSVWIDYLILQRPLVFYYYDNFEDKDSGVLYDLKEDPPGHFCYAETELFEIIKRIVYDYDSMRPSEHIVSKYHKYVDGNSCKRYFEEIIKDN